jgi:hypothetical protein
LAVGFPKYLTKRCALRADLKGKTNMWRIVAILALSLSGCVSTKLLDQSFGAGQGRQIVKSEIAFFLSGQVSAEPRQSEVSMSARMRASVNQSKAVDILKISPNMAPQN